MVHVLATHCDPVTHPVHRHRHCASAAAAEGPASLRNVLLLCASSLLSESHCLSVFPRRCCNSRRSLCVPWHWHSPCSVSVCPSDSESD
jgi:hypothetical protein